mgnify:CR=1 FL=1
MEAYKNLSGNSGVTHYEIGNDNILVRFKGKTTKYKYSNLITGSTHVETMKQLAENGLGLCTYITTNSWVKNHFTKY